MKNWGRCIRQCTCHPPENEGIRGTPEKGPFLKRNIHRLQASIFSGYIFVKFIQYLIRLGSFGREGNAGMLIVQIWFDFVIAVMFFARLYMFFLN